MIELKNLQKAIGGNTAVDIPELIVQEGKIVALVGSVGSGKEIVFEILSGRALPTVGTTRIAGFDPARDQGDLSYRVGVLFPEDALYKNLTPLANLEFQCSLYSLPRSRAEEVLAEVGLVDQGSIRSDKLPSGLQRRLAVGRAILHNPKALLLFEPFIRCDETTIDLLSNIFLQKAAGGAALLIFAADATNLEPLCDTIYSLNQGRLLEGYRPKEDRQEYLPFKIPVRMDDKVVLFNPADILYADAGEGRANIVTASMRLPTQFTLSELEQRLGRSGFFRAHRSYLVNLQHVKEVIPYTRNSFTLRLDDAQNTEIPLSKSSAGELKDLLGY